MPKRSRTLSDAVINPIATKLREENEERVERLFELVWPYFEGNWPLGYDHDFKRKWYITQSDEDAATIAFDVNNLNWTDGSISIGQGVDEIEERTAVMIEELAAKFLELAKRIRSELIM